MFSILSDVIRLAARQSKPRPWNPPSYWTLPGERPPLSRSTDRRERDQRRRWLRDTGIL